MLRFYTTLVYGKKLKKINEAYRSIKLPHEFPRAIRDFSSLAFWKASELKVFMLYTGVTTLFKSLEIKYFEHFCLYILIIRQMCDRISDFDADNSRQLISIWHQKLQELYGEYEMTYL